MKNTLIVRREYISNDVIDILNRPAGLASIESIDNGHSYIINFNPNTTEISKYRENMKKLIEAKNVTIDVTSIDKIIEGLILSNLATFYGNVYTALMKEVVNQYVGKNIDNTFSVSDLAKVLSKI
jgi:hypothetical protein